MGRPTTYTESVADEICERLAVGESLRSVCRDDNMPAIRTIFNWFRMHEGFLQQYARAKEESADALVEDCLDIADNQVKEQLVVDGTAVFDGGGNPVMVATQQSIAHAKLRVDTRKWKASKLKPKKYGDKMQQELTGRDGAPIEVDNHHTVEFVDASGNNLINEVESK